MHRLILLLLTCLPLAVALDLRPLAGPDAPVYATRRASILAQWRALTVDAYQQHGVHGAWDADLVRLSEHVAAVIAGSPSALPDAEAAALATRLTAPGACPDPLAAWCAFKLAKARKDRFSTGMAAIQAFDADAANRPAVERHPRLLDAVVCMELLGQYGRTPKPEHKERAQQLADRLAATIGDAIRADECRVFPSVFMATIHDINLNHQDFGEPVVAAIDAAVAAAKPPLWLGYGMRGTIRIANAWAWRGSGWASTVTPEGWKGFERNLKEADAFLTQSWQANPADPLAAAYACTLAGAGNSATPLDEWLLRSSKACFDHSTAFNTAIGFLLPRWGGSYDQMLALGCDCVDTGRFDTDVPWRIIDAARRAISDAEQMQGKAQVQAALVQPRVAAAIAACLDGYRAQHPASASRYACVRAAILWHAGNAEAARRALAEVPEAELNPGVSNDFRVDLRQLKGPLPRPAPDF